MKTDENGWENPSPIFIFILFFDKNMIEFGKAGIENEIEYVDIWKQRYGQTVGKLNKDHMI